MTENRTDEQILEEKKNNMKEHGAPLLQNVIHTPVCCEPASTPGFEIAYVPHKTQGLQSASDMWIDKGRLYEGISKDARDLESIKKLIHK
ncbi:hypothetical protein [Methanolobus sp. WCC5]|uniref:hypothetical protein n=1 Tax=Methanolobus sp. WCC5 TaxID=3125785 RepID=UPI003256957C